jgi:hypothetical protein
VIAEPHSILDYACRVCDSRALQEVFQRTFGRFNL